MRQNKNGKKRKNQFTKDNQPPSVNKRVKKKKTILREAIGLKSWDSLKQYITENGVPKLITELKKLKGKGYVQSHLDAAEYFQPKLSRTEHTGEIKTEAPMDFSKLSVKELKLYIELIEKAKPKNGSTTDQG